MRVCDQFFCILLRELQLLSLGGCSFPKGSAGPVDLGGAGVGGASWKSEGKERCNGMYFMKRRIN